MKQSLSTMEYNHHTENYDDDQHRIMPYHHHHHHHYEMKYNVEDDTNNDYDEVLNNSTSNHYYSGHHNNNNSIISKRENIAVPITPPSTYPSSMDDVYDHHQYQHYSKSSSNNHTTSVSQRQRQGRNSDVSELFLAEAKAAQAKVELSLNNNTMTIPTVDTADFDTYSYDTAAAAAAGTYNTYKAMIGQQQQQYDRNGPIINNSGIQPSSSSSIDAVGPEIDQCYNNNKQPIITLQVVNDTIQMMTTSTNNNSHTNITTTTENIHQHGAYNYHYPNHRSYRKPLGLSYELRKTDSASTFQSLDGLRNSYPLMRDESSKHKKMKQRQQQQQQSKSNKSSSNKQQRRKRSTSSQQRSSYSSSSSILHAFEEYTKNHWACFAPPPITNATTATSPSTYYLNMCHGMDHLMTNSRSFAVPESYRNRYASTAYDNSHDTSSRSNHHDHQNRDGPENNSVSSSPTRIGVRTTPTSNINKHNELLQIQTQLRDLRTKLMNFVNKDDEYDNDDDDDDVAEIVTTTSSLLPQRPAPFACCTSVAITPPPATPPMKETQSNTKTTSKTIPKKRVHFTLPLVTKVAYRPYTDQCDIAKLYFQEEELEELEYDREMVLHDQFECQYDEMTLAVRIAYQLLNPTDE